MLHFLKLPRSRLQRLGPYPSLIVLAIPVAVVEPLKLVAVAFVGTGHWLTGTAVIVAAYAASLLFVEQLFQIVKPKLLKLRWFATGWGWFTKLRASMLAHFKG
jgi:hypothetical protein